MTTSQSLQKCPKCGYSSNGKSRSNPQNSYYWGVVINLLSEHTGFTPDEMHEVLKYKFLGYFKEISIVKGDVRISHEVWTSKSTTSLTTAEMEEYLSRIRTYASCRLECYIPEPNEITDETHKTWFD